MDNKVEIFTDGACRGNPGPGGWAALLRYQDKEKRIAGAEAHTTNNRMELLAAINALSALKNARQAIVTTDSRYLKDGITRWLFSWKKNGWRTAAKQEVKNKDLWQRLDELIQLHQVEWHWVKAHNGHVENELVDQLANKAIDDLLTQTDKKDL